MLRDKGRLRNAAEAIGRIRHVFSEHVPDSGQEHAANGNDGFLVTAAGFDSAVTFTKFGVIFGLNHGIGNLNQKRFQTSTGFGDTSRLDVTAALVIARAAAGPRDEILGRREHGHIDTDFGNERNCSHWILVEARDGVDQIKSGCERRNDSADFNFNDSSVRFELVDVIEALAKFDGLFMADSAVDGGLNLRQRCFAAEVNKGRNIECFSGMCENKLSDGTCGFTEHVSEHNIEFEVGNGQTVLGAVLFAVEHIAEFDAVANEIAELADAGGRDKAGTNHTAHEQIANPAGVLTVGLVSLLRFGVLGVRENDMAGFFKDIEDGNPVLTGGFHADLNTLILVQPLRKLPQAFGESGETGFVIDGATIGIGDTNAGENPCFVNVETAAVV